MADTEETPSQRQARIRREKREAKIRSEGDDRLNKITKLSGRSAEIQKESSAFNSPTATPQPTTSPPQPLNVNNAADPSQVQAQEEYIRNVLRAKEGPGNVPQSNQPEDPLEKMLSQITAAMSGEGKPGELPFSPDDLSKATGLPSFVSNLMFAGISAPSTPAQEKTAWLWKLIHLVFSFAAGVYLLHVINYSFTTFGVSPPAPATLQNPFLVFITGELLIESSRIATMGQGVKMGSFAWLQILKDVGRDGCIVVFMMGLASYMKGWT